MAALSPKWAPPFSRGHAATVAAAQSFPATGGDDKWAYATINAQLAAGNNSVAVTFTTTAPVSSGSMMLDMVEFRPVLEAELGAATAGDC